MSDSSNQTGDVAIRLTELLKEYQGRLTAIHADVSRIREARIDCDVKAANARSNQEIQAWKERKVLLTEELQNVSFGFHAMQPALMKLVRRVSQRLEHTNIDDVIRIELEVRLAEFETIIQMTMMRVQ